MKKETRHTKSFAQLTLGNFPHQFASYLYPVENGRNVINYEAMDEVTDPGPDFNPKDIKTRFKHDVIFTFFPEPERTQRPQESEKGTSWTTHVSIEIKATRWDLLTNGFKISHYMGATDFLFLAVPKALLPDAVDLLQRKPLVQDLKYIGIIDITDGQIVVMPGRQQDKDQLRQAMICRRIYEQNKRVYKPEAVYLVHTTLTEPKDKPKLLKIGPFHVNRQYADLVKSNLVR